MATQPHWFPMLATPNILTIAEECDCVCSEKGPCCCHGGSGTSSSSDTQEIPPQEFEEFDGVDDILAVSHLSEKSSIKKRIPLLRAKTLPAIISPSLSIIQAPLDPDTKVPTITHTEVPSKISPSGKSGCKRGKKTNTEKWQLLVDDDGNSSKSPGNSPRNSFSSTGSVTSQASSSKDNRSEHGGSRAGLVKLARFLTTRDKSANGGDRHGSDSSLAPDSLSIRKSSSIDSLLESSSLDIGSPNDGVPSSGGKPIPVSPSVPAKLEKEISKQGKSSRQSSLERLIDSGPLTKAERKKLEKYRKFNIDFQALCASVEHKQLERAKSILESTDVNINSVNPDGFTPLDLAVMTTNVAMVQLLQSHGATENLQFSCRDSRSTQLQNLVREASRYVESLESSLLSAIIKYL
ncbi:uncharacterized protein [Parasteatoda tepidariorum]|uniref:uncharacterized protein n=1 Tax=Parasteatoda tepidariorum TaxID=114398 RepID=UPI0039BD3F01